MMNTIVEIVDSSRRQLKVWLTLALSVFLLALSGIATAGAREIVLDAVRSEEETFRVVSLAEGLQNPWGVVFLPDGRLLISERPGRLNILEDGRIVPVGGLPQIDVGGQGGLLDVALHPDYRDNGWIYLAYSADSGRSRGTRIARARLQGDRLVDVQELFRMNNGSTAGVHFGSRMVFLPDRTLLFTIGDRGDRDRAQSLMEHAGKTLRINDDGTIPADNPFVDTPGALPEIYTYGNRNAQGMAIHPDSGRVWQHEHGPRGGDEVNIIEAGRNYGWPVITYGREYWGGEVSPLTEAPGMEQPVIYWVPSIAPSGMSFYSGGVFNRWQGNMFVGALAGQHLRRLVVDGREIVHQEVLFEGELGRIRDVREGPDGYLYLLTDARNGALLRLEPVR
jgi:glucose/arabinose dehydrogenase